MLCRIDCFRSPLHSHQIPFMTIDQTTREFPYREKQSLAWLKPWSGFVRKAAVGQLSKLASNT